MSNDLILKTFPAPVLITGGARYGTLLRALPWGAFIVGALLSWPLFSHSLARAGSADAFVAMLLMSAAAFSLVVSLAAVSYFMVTSPLSADEMKARSSDATVSWNTFYLFEALVCSASAYVLYIRQFAG
jgi:isocitrate dehydrogenase kinase/phosphatase